MILIVSCPICHQQLELLYRKSVDPSDDDSDSIKSIPCNHLYKYSDELFYQHSFIVKIDSKGKILPTPFFGEKRSQTKPALYNSYLRPTVPIQDLYQKVESLSEELTYYKEKSLFENISDRSELVINREELQQILELDQVKNDKNLLEQDYVNMLMNNQDWFLELQSLRDKIKKEKSPNEDLKINFEILRNQYTELKEEFKTLEDQNNQLFQQLLEAQISSVVEVSNWHNSRDKDKTDIETQIGTFSDPSNETLIQMLQNELLITSEQKNVYEQEINRLSGLLYNSEKELSDLSKDSVSITELKAKNQIISEKFNTYGQSMEALVNNIGNESVKETVKKYFNLLVKRISDLEDLYLNSMVRIRSEIDQYRKVMNLPGIAKDHPALSVPKLELENIHLEFAKLLEDYDKTLPIKKKIPSPFNKIPDPNEFYEKVTSKEWKYSKDEQLIFIKALFRLDSFIMDTAKEITVDDQLKEFMKFFKELKVQSVNVIKALNNLVTNNENQFKKVPKFMQDYLLKYVGKISELDLEKDVFKNEDLKLLSYSFMISDLPIMEITEDERSPKKEEKILKTNSKRDSIPFAKKSDKKVSKKTRKKRTTKTPPKKVPTKKEKEKVLIKNRTKNILNLKEMEINDLI
ncbi:MAG: hypothetical protein HeimC3_13030 [Candidatus Heimdallarchaeota archaeon LC_3]|nr:MAG: hypothetical protein HeimC3_15920 [Candidatus Heimdallarchaeota archaeon LC_3]OLS26029.1 MAG: hypothetical protein HeimC3_13030 [Candidatus Heimdallarchaeota archaeon LC_3]